MDELLYQYNPWWEDKYSLSGIIRRERYLRELSRSFAKKSIVFLSGLRRVGKTTLMKLMILEGIESGIEKEKILYISLDDYLLRAKTILGVVAEYRKIHKIPVDEKIYLFLDEVTYKEDFRQQLKNIYDSQNVKLVASSSSASILRDKKAMKTTDGWRMNNSSL